MVFCHGVLVPCRPCRLAPTAGLPGSNPNTEIHSPLPQGPGCAPYTRVTLLQGNLLGRTQGTPQGTYSLEALQAVHYKQVTRWILGHSTGCSCPKGPIECALQSGYLVAGRRQRTPLQDSTVASPLVYRHRIRVPSTPCGPSPIFFFFFFFFGLYAGLLLTTRPGSWVTPLGPSLSLRH